MTIEEIANIIEESSREIAKESDECCCSGVKEEISEECCCSCGEEEGSEECCCSDGKEAREFLITTIGNLIDRELYELGTLMFDIGEEEFGSDEEKSDRTSFYEKLDGSDKSLKAIRKLAEIKRYLEAQNNGEIKASVDASYEQDEI
jgi:hypothetical protein